MASSRRPFQRFLEYAALALVAVMPTQVGVPVLKLNRAVVTLTVADILVWVLAGLLVARWIVTARREKLHWPPLHVWLIAAVAGLSSAAWLDPGLGKTEILTTIKELIQYVGLFVAAPMVFLSALGEREARRKALWVWAGVTVVVVLIGSAQAFLEAAGAAPEWLSATRHRELQALEVDPRNVVGLFGSRTVYGVYLALSLPVLLPLSVEIQRPVLRILLNVVIVLGAASITAPGPFLALAVGLVVTHVLMADTGMGRAVGASIGLSIALFGLAFGPFRAEKLAWSMTVREEITETVWVDAAPQPDDDGFAPAPPDEELDAAPYEPDDDGFAPAPPDEELDAAPYEPDDDGFAPAPPDEELEEAPLGGEADEGGDSAAQPEIRVVGERDVLALRYAEWGAALDMLGSRERPVAVIGAGPGQYQEKIGGYFGVLPKSGKLEPDFQNQYLVIAVDLGLVGLMAFVLLMWRSGRVAWSRLPVADGDLPDVLPALIGALAALVVANFFGGTLVRGTGVTILFIVSLIILWGYPTRGNEKR
ncbi:MAG: hypothetical protein GF320_16490 [Armatimonadia bacterium]|nr:hypothetical protein [Armatimonadia bacterium]